MRVLIAPAVHEVYTKSPSEREKALHEKCRAFFVNDTQLVQTMWRQLSVLQ